MGKASNRKKINREKRTQASQEPPPKKFWQQNWVKYGALALGVIVLVLSAYLILDGTGLLGTEQEEVEEAAADTEDPGQNDAASGEEGRDDETSSKPIVTIEMAGGELIELELEPEVAPNTVDNFIHLIEEGFYDGLTFHRVVPDFVIQGGCPEGTGQGDPGYNIPGEFAANGYENDLKHTRGVVSMARSELPDSAGSQFFIVVDDSPELDGEYAAFGRVIEGMEVVERIVQVERDSVDKPLEEEVMQKVTVETFGVEYDPPTKL